MISTSVTPEKTARKLPFPTPKLYIGPGPILFNRPAVRVRKLDMNIEIWAVKRKLPFLLTFPPAAHAVIVPVAPDLKMVFGVAKMVRDYGGDRVQYEALKVAPLAPGDAFVGAGSRYRFGHTALAVIFDEQKRTSPELISRAVRRAAEESHAAGATSLVIPDFTENLLTQPNWITQEQRRNTAEIAAVTTFAALRNLKGTMKTIKIWCWDPRNASFFHNELKRL